MLCVIRDRWTREWRTAPASLAPLLRQAPTVRHCRVVRVAWRRGSANNTEER